MPHSGCSGSSQAQQGDNSVDAFQCPGKVPGPSGIQLLVFSTASMSQSCNPWQADRETVSLLGIPARCPALLPFTSCKHHPLAQSFLLQFLEPFALERCSLYCPRHAPISTNTQIQPPPAAVTTGVSPLPLVLPATASLLWKGQTRDRE